MRNLDRARSLVQGNCFAIAKGQFSILGYHESWVVFALKELEQVSLLTRCHVSSDRKCDEIPMNLILQRRKHHQNTRKDYHVRSVPVGLVI